LMALELLKHDQKGIVETRPKAKRPMTSQIANFRSQIEKFNLKFEI